jgi:four helix bundle protein
MKEKFKPVEIDSVNIVNKAFEFSLNLIEFYIFLVRNNELEFSEKLLKSGTSIRENIEQSLAADSRYEFLFKVSIASKNAIETRYWLKEIQMRNIIHSRCDDCVDKLNEIINILSYMTQASYKTQVHLNIGNLN